MALADEQVSEVARLFVLHKAAGLTEHEFASAREVVLRSDPRAPGRAQTSSVVFSSPAELHAWDHTQQAFDPAWHPYPGTVAITADGWVEWGRAGCRPALRVAAPQCTALKWHKDSDRAFVFSGRNEAEPRTYDAYCVRLPDNGAAEKFSLYFVATGGQVTEEADAQSPRFRRSSGKQHSGTPSWMLTANAEAGL
eukprot:TRINITY_DN50995_c0_g1_i1.p2 TRINITY_DN50995_c0_g1~~TRINITY_DN50995_c0_g1_i1.p2  ORF type:complete len:219 (+),score=56.64 TRINITY_DN50995_c0_g1_i1:75-659(+)